MKLNKGDIVLFNGDSITHGNRGTSMDCNHILGHGYQFTVAGELGLRFPGTKYYNRGVSGTTMSSMYSRWQDDVFEVKPKLISILIGINDILFGYQNKLELSELKRRYEDGFRTLLTETKAELPDSYIMLLEPFFLPNMSAADDFSMVPHPTCHTKFVKAVYDNEMKAYFESGVKEMQQIVASLADEYQTLFVPLQSVFEDAAIRMGSNDYLVWDGVHPTVVGHKIINDCWLKTFYRE